MADAILMPLARIEKDIGSTPYQTHNLPTKERITHDEPFIEEFTDSHYENAEGETQEVRAKRVRIDYDMGKKLYKRGVVSEDQYRAGCHYSNLAYLSRGSNVKSALANAGVITGHFSGDARDALSELVAIQRHISPLERIIIEGVFVNDISLTQVCKDLKQNFEAAKIILRVALDIINRLRHT